MPTTAEILSFAPGAAYLAANNVGKSNLYNNGATLNPNLPQQIYALYFVLNKIYTLDPNYSGLYANVQYLWEIMGRYGLASQGLSGSGGSAGGITPTGLFPIFITSSNFTTATAYNNPNIVGQNIAIFVNEYSQQWMVAGATTFTMTSTGINITLPGFDATAFQYTILIDKLGSG